MLRVNFDKDNLISEMRKIEIYKEDFEFLTKINLTSGHSIEDLVHRMISSVKSNDMNLKEEIKKLNGHDYSPFEYGEWFDGWETAIEAVLELIDNKEGNQANEVQS